MSGLYVLLDTRKPGVYEYTISDKIYIFNFEPFYVGISQYLKSRPYSHVHDAVKYPNRCMKHRIINRIINQTGSWPDILILLDGDFEWEFLCKLEVEFIKIIGRRDKKLGPLSNHSDGGEGVIGNFGELNPFFGRTHDQKTRYKMSLKVKAAYSIPEYRNNLSIIRRNTKRSEYAKLKTTESLLKYHINRRNNSDVLKIISTENQRQFILNLLSKFPSIFTSGYKFNHSEILKYIGKGGKKILHKISRNPSRLRRFD